MGILPITTPRPSERHCIDRKNPVLVEMLWLAHPTRRRFTLQVRGAGKKLQMWDAGTGTWNSDCVIASSPTAIVHLYHDGRTLDFRSRPGYSQWVLVFELKDGRSIGTIEVNASGALLVRKGVERAYLNRDWPVL